MRVKIISSAHADILDGYAFYDRQQAGLGDHFADSIYGEIETLQLYAGIHRKVYGFYRLLSKRFPYAIYYDIADGEALVYAIIDCRRNPDWIVDHLTRI